MAYKDGGLKVAFLPSLLLLSATRSSGLMTLRSITPGTLDGFSAGILVSTHIQSPRFSIVNMYSSQNKLSPRNAYAEHL
jgi:hypothetical protein